ncbi:hypothetical protein GCM10027348_29460 [Hymenobacter tenuis]
MHFKTFVATTPDLTFKIEEDSPDIGVYLYVYSNGHCTFDDLQDTIQDCMEIAEEYYGLPLSAWTEEYGAEGSGENLTTQKR